MHEVSMVGGQRVCLLSLSYANLHVLRLCLNRAVGVKSSYGEDVFLAAPCSLPSFTPLNRPSSCNGAPNTSPGRAARH